MMYGGRTEEELFDFVETNQVYDDNGLSISTLDELFAHVFQGQKNAKNLARELYPVEKVRILKMHIDSLTYNLNVAMSGLRRASKEKERLQQMRLI